LGPAAERYKLSKILNVKERDLPTNCVSSYRLPFDVWIPVLVGSKKYEYLFGSLRVAFEADVNFVYKLFIGDAIYDITSGKDEQHEMRVEQENEEYQLITKMNSDAGEYMFLNNRVFVEIRPLCVFFRPGVLLKVTPPNDFDDGEICAVVLSYDFEKARYNVLCSCGTKIQLNPYEVENCVQGFKKRVYVKLNGLCLSETDFSNLVFYCDGKISVMESADIDETKDVLSAELCIPREDLQDDFEVKGFVGNGYVSVIIVMYNEKLKKDEIELLCSGDEAKSSYIVANIHIKNLTFDCSGRKNVFFAVGYKT